MAKLNIRIHEASDPYMDARDAELDELIRIGKEDIKAFNPKTVTIGNQAWMQENLAIDDGGDGISYNEKNKQYYYTWYAAMRVVKSIPGWHLPSAEEWNAAAEACGAEVVDNGYKDDPYLRDYDNTKKLYDTLRVLPVGSYYDGGFYDVGSCAYFWSATEYDSNGAYGRHFDTSVTVSQYTYYKVRGFSVRLVKD